jgi:AraC-like DNA-binding protein
MSKKNIQASFYSTEPLGNDSIQLIGWSGNHWDNIAYFPTKFQIGYVREGKGEFILEGKSYAIRKGQFFLIHPGRINSGKPDEQSGWTVDTIAIKKEIIQDIFGMSTQITFQEFITEDKKLQQCFVETLAYLNCYENTIEWESRLYQFLNDLISAKATILLQNDLKETSNFSIERAIAFITKNFKSSFSLDDLASHSCLSKFHLLRIFKAQTGLTPYTYQIQLRLNEARRLMFQNVSLTDVALELGFADQAHFTNTFKKYANGANPSDLLKTAISFNFQE